MTRWRIRWRSRSRVVRDAVEDELAFHFRERIDALVAEGRSRADATRLATEQFGDTDAVRRALATIDRRIAARRGTAAWIDGFRHDLRHVVRSLLSAPGFTLLVATLLALGIGANGAIFAFVDRLFLRAPGAVGDPAQVVRVYRQVPAGSPRNPSETTVTATMPYAGFRDVARTFAPGTVSGYIDRRVPIGRGESPPMARVAWIAADYFTALGVGAPALGRYPTSDECRVELTTAIAVISHEEWQRAFNRDPNVIGTRVELDRVTFTIVGVAPRGFAGIDLDAVRYWMPMGAMPWRFQPPWHQARNASFVRVFAREERRTRAQIEGEATAAYRANAPAREQSFTILTGPILETRGPLWQGRDVDIALRLAGVAALVLLIACANAASLLLARALRRRREFALRIALGISRARLVSLLFTETLAISLIAAAAAVAIAHAGATAMHRVLLTDQNWSGGLFDRRLAFFAFGTAMLTAIVTGVPVAWRIARRAPVSSLQSDPRTGSARRSRLQAGLLVVQVTLSIVLLTGAAAFVQSLRAIAAIDTGYDVDRLLLIRLRNDDGMTRTQEAADLLERLLPQLRVRAGVESTALAGLTPLGGYTTNELYRADGSHIEVPGRGEMQPAFSHVSPGFFQTTGIAVERGREFVASDVSGAADVTIVNRVMAAMLWPNQDALGQCVRVGTANRPCATVIGVVENTNRQGLIDVTGGLAPLYFLPIGQGRGEFSLPGAAVVRSAAGTDLDRLAASLLGDLRATLPAGVYANVTPMSETFVTQLRSYTIGATLFTAFGLLALAVAAIGTYSTLAYAVGARTREIGIRLALGAPRPGLMRFVIRQGLALVSIGVVAGVALALLLGRLIVALLYQTSPSDPGVLASACAAMTLAALAGCLVPAWRAARVDPIIVLRAE